MLWRFLQLAVGELTLSFVSLDRALKAETSIERCLARRVGAQFWLPLVRADIG